MCGCHAKTRKSHLILNSCPKQMEKRLKVEAKKLICQFWGYTHLHVQGVAKLAVK